MITLDNFNQEYTDPIEEQRIRHFVCMEMGRRIHRYIKAMHGSKQQMLRFEEHLKDLSLEEKEAALHRLEPQGYQGIRYEDRPSSCYGKLFRHL